MANQIIITGRIGKDPEVRHSAEGKPWSFFSVAEGRRDQEPTWFDVKCFGRLAEVMGEYGGKGRQILVAGRMVQETYEKNGETRKAWKLIASSIEFLDSKRGKGGVEAVEEAVAAEPEEG
jgi:single-strand DNA-binding protein